MPQAYCRRNLNSLKRRSRSRRQRRFSASVEFLRSWRANSRAAAVRGRCLPYCGECPGRPPPPPPPPPGGGGGFGAAPGGVFFFLFNTEVGFSPLLFPL